MFIFIVMAAIDATRTYGVNFPFLDSRYGVYLDMTTKPETEVRANLLHLILTRKGSRYFLPDFGTRIYDFVFEQNDTITFQQIEEDIRMAVSNYIPNLDIQSIDIKEAVNDPTFSIQTADIQKDERLFRAGTYTDAPYTATVKINYTVNNGAFSSSDFIIINI
jgi:phage baseplate assembly protein W